MNIIKIFENMDEQNNLIIYHEGVVGRGINGVLENKTRITKGEIVTSRDIKDRVITLTTESVDMYEGCLKIVNTIKEYEKIKTILNNGHGLDFYLYELGDVILKNKTTTYIPLNRILYAKEDRSIKGSEEGVSFRYVYNLDVV